MTNPVTLDIGNNGNALLFAGADTDKVALLAFHGGGGVAGTPDMLTPFVQNLMAGGGMAVVAPSYRTLNADNATFEDMRADAARALDWATSNLPTDAKLYLMGASFGGLLALDALLEAPTKTQSRVAGLILLNAVTDTSAQTGWKNRVVTPASHGNLSPLLRLDKSPLLDKLHCYLCHGGADDVVPVEASRRFAKLWPKERVTLTEFPKSGHGFFNRTPHMEAVATAVRQFVGLQALNAPMAKLHPTPQEETAAPAPLKPTVKPRGLLPETATIAYGIGAQKAGTSWLFEQLAKSADCHTASTKELHYFDAMYVKGEDSHIKTRLNQITREVSNLTPGVDPANRKRLRNIQVLADRLAIHATKPDDHMPYVNYMKKGYAGQKIICDFTPSYATLDADGFAQMNSIGSAKFIFILRDPVARLWSQIRMAITAAHPKLADAAYEAKCTARARDMCANRSLSKIPRADYLRTIEALEASVTPEQIHYVFYENLFTQNAVDGICHFLDISPVKIEAETKVNLGRSTSLPEDLAILMEQGLSEQYSGVRARFGADVPAKWRSGNAVATATTQPVQAQKAVGASLPLIGRFLQKGTTAKNAPVIVFPHIPKTAGQTVVKELLRVLPRKTFSPVRTHAAAPPDAQMPAGFKLYAGHIDWIDLETLPANRFAFTVLRDPHERIASFYFYLIREAAKLSQKELASKSRTNMRMVSTLSADDYFFGGDRAWQNFIQDHYNNFYCNYMITRKIRGWKDVRDLDAKTLVDRAVTGSGALQKVYSLQNLDALETDLQDILGAQINVQGNYVNAGPEAQTANRWSELLKRFERDNSVTHLERFAEADFALMKRLGLPT